MNQEEREGALQRVSQWSFTDWESVIPIPKLRQQECLDGNWMRCERWLLESQWEPETTHHASYENQSSTSEGILFEGELVISNCLIRKLSKSLFPVPCSLSLVPVPCSSVDWREIHSHELLHEQEKGSGGELGVKRVRSSLLLFSREA
jgi:hypothetical protein